MRAAIFLFSEMSEMVVDPRIAHFRPVIRETRVPVAIILGAPARGMQIDETAG